MRANSPVVEPALIAVPAIPEHELERPIASGAYGQVWLARSALGTLRAVKIVRRDRFERAEDFEREWRGLQRFEPVSRTQDGLVDILQIGRQDDWFYYVMELADAAAGQRSDGVLECGGNGAIAPSQHSNTPALHFSIAYIPLTLRQMIRDRGALPAAEAVALGQRLASALTHLHAEGLVHRDVKPSNILFINGQPKLADAGLVAAVDDARSLVGTPGYIPPEGPGTPQADIYGLGKVLYEAAFGKDRQEFPQLPSDVATRPDHAVLLELNEIIVKACERDVRDRYQSANQIQGDLHLMRRGQSVLAKRRLQRHTKLLKRVCALGLLLVGISLGAGYVLHVIAPPSHIPRLSPSKQANDEYTEARYFYSRNTAEALRKAIARFERAIEIDPKFTAAYGGLASCYSWDMLGFQTVRARTIFDGGLLRELDGPRGRSRPARTCRSLGSISTVARRYFRWSWTVIILRSNCQR